MTEEDEKNFIMRKNVGHVNNHFFEEKLITDNAKERITKIKTKLFEPRVGNTKTGDHCHITGK